MRLRPGLAVHPYTFRLSTHCRQVHSPFPAPILALVDTPFAVRVSPCHHVIASISSFLSKSPIALRGIRRRLRTLTVVNWRVRIRRYSVHLLTRRKRQASSTVSSSAGSSRESPARARLYPRRESLTVVIVMVPPDC